MKKRNFRYEEGGDVTYGEDERPAPKGMADAAELMPEKQKTFKQAFAEAKASGEKAFTWQGKRYTTETAGASRSASAPSPAPSPAPQRQTVEVAAKRYPKDDESKSVSERMKSARERARMGSGSTDTRSVSERIRSALGFAKGGSVRGGGCEQRGKTKGRFV